MSDSVQQRLALCEQRQKKSLKVKASKWGDLSNLEHDYIASYEEG